MNSPRQRRGYIILALVIVLMTGVGLLASYLKTADAPPMQPMYRQVKAMPTDTVAAPSATKGKAHKPKSEAKKKKPTSGKKKKQAPPRRPSTPTAPYDAPVD